MSANYTIVNSEESFNAMLDHISMYKIIAYDVETNGVNPRKHSVIGIAVSGAIGESYYLPLAEWSPEFSKLVHSPQTLGWIPSILNLLSTRKLVMHNGAFDIPITLNDLGTDLTDALYADTMLLKHTVDEEHPFGLKEIGAKVATEIGLGSEEEAQAEQLKLKEHLASRGASTSKTNYELYKGDKEIIGEYACKDVDLTLRLYHYYSRMLERQGLTEFFYEDEVMPLYREVTIPMEQGGIPLDLPKIRKALSELSVELNDVEAQIQKELTELDPDFMERKFSSLYPIEGAVFKQRYAKHQALSFPLTPTGKFSITQKTIAQLPDGSAKLFFQNSVDENMHPEVKHAIWSLLHKEREEQDYAINLKSTKELADIFFTTLKESPLSYTEKTKEPQVDDDTLKHLAEKRGYLSAALLRDYNKLVKLKSTYMERFLENHEDGIFYPSFFQHRTVTGRYGSNLQQLPREKEEDEIPSELVRKYTNMIREFFIAGPEHKLIDADYEQLELRVFTHISDDPWLISEMSSGNDLYSTIGMESYNIIDASANKSEPNYFKKLYPGLRQAAKSFTLGIPYGMKAWQLSKMLEISQGEAQQIIDNYLGRASELKHYMERQERSMQRDGKVQTEYGRIRRLPLVRKLYNGFGDRLTDHKYRWKLEESMGKSRVKHIWNKYKSGMNIAKNFPVQSGAASIVNRAAIQIMRNFKSEGLNAYIAAQVHDQLIVRCLEADALKCAEIMQRCMEQTNTLKVPLIAKPVIANNMRESH